MYVNITLSMDKLRDIDKKFLILREWINIFESDVSINEIYSCDLVCNERNRRNELNILLENPNAYNILNKNNAFEYLCYKTPVMSDTIVLLIEKKVTSKTFKDWEFIYWTKFAEYESKKVINIIKEIFDRIPTEYHEYIYNGLSSNKYAMELLYMHPEHICWMNLCKNENLEAIQMLKNNRDKIDWQYLSGNENSEVIELLKTNEDLIEWHILCLNKNPEIIKIFIENPKNIEKIKWNELSSNPNAIHILKKNMNMIDWSEFCKNENPATIRILMENQDKIDWETLCENSNAIHLIEQNMDKLNDICWKKLNNNINAMSILKNNQQKIEWIVWFYETYYHCSGNAHCIFYNPSIFTYDYNKIETEKYNINKDFIEWVWQPINYNKWKSWKLIY